MRSSVTTNIEKAKAPQNTQKIAMNLPKCVDGYTSPYPIVAIVIAIHQTEFQYSPKLCRLVC